MALVIKPCPTSPGDTFHVYTGQWVCGVISKGRTQLKRDAQLWIWTIQLGGKRPPGVTGSGSASSFAAAQDAFEQNWIRWISFMGLTETDSVGG
jgi:hypothetical protein